jgi:SAM-dependent methyltransferase
VSAPPLSLNGWLRWDVLRRILDELAEIETVLEIGAGLGAVAFRLAERYEYVGVERDPTSFTVARDRLARLGRGTMVLGDPSAIDAERRFDLVGAFEVLEHVEDDAGAVRDWASRLRPGGRLLLSVPAWRKRWGAADESAGHLRRYDPDELAAALAGAGLEDVRVVVYGFPLGYLLQPTWNLLARRRPARAIEQRTAESGRWFQPGDALAPVTQAVSLPFRLAQRSFGSSNLGTGLVAVARRAG